MRGMILTATASLALALAVPSTQAQEDGGPQKRENVVYYTMYLVDFAPGAEDAAWELIYDHFVPVDTQLGRDVIPFDFHSGGWDHVVFFPMGANTDELEWSRSPADVAWWNALVEQEGGAEQAEAMMDRFNELVTRSARHIVHRHMDTAEQ